MTMSPAALDDAAIGDAGRGRTAGTAELKVLADRPQRAGPADQQRRGDADVSNDQHAVASVENAAIEDTHRGVVGVAGDQGGGPGRGFSNRHRSPAESLELAKNKPLALTGAVCSNWPPAVTESPDSTEKTMPTGDDLRSGARYQHVAEIRAEYAEGCRDLILLEQAAGGHLRSLSDYGDTATSHDLRSGAGDEHAALVDGNSLAGVELAQGAALHDGNVAVEHKDRAGGLELRSGARDLHGAGVDVNPLVGDRAGAGRRPASRKGAVEHLDLATGVERAAGDDEAAAAAADAQDEVAADRASHARQGLDAGAGLFQRPGAGDDAGKASVIAVDAD